MPIYYYNKKEKRFKAYNKKVEVESPSYNSTFLTSSIRQEIDRAQQAATAYGTIPIQEFNKRYPECKPPPRYTSDDVQPQYQRTYRKRQLKPKKVFFPKPKKQKGRVAKYIVIDGVKHSI